MKKIAIAVLGILMTLCIIGTPNVQAADQVYVSAMPEEWPLEYYNSGNKAYEGVLPEILKEASEAAGVNIKYTGSTSQDERLELAKNHQVDLVWTYGLSNKELQEAKLTPGNVVLRFQQGKKEVYVRPAYTSSVPTETRQALENAFSNISQEEIAGKYLSYAQIGHEEQQVSYIYRYVIPGLLIIAIGFLIFLPIRLRIRRKQLKDIIHLDDETGGKNFAYWKEKYVECIKDGNREHYAVWYLVAGIDSVAQINGYDEASNALKLFAEVCNRHINSTTEAVARFNEFSFVFFVQYNNVEHMKQRILDLYQDIDDTFSQEKKRYLLEMYTGVYRLTGADNEPLKSIQYSEIAMQYARRHYKDCIMYDETVEHETITEHVMEHEAVHGLMNDEFIMFMQPLIQLETGKICGAEALVRWQNPNRGLLTPEEFLKVVKKKHLTGKMNMEIYRQGCRYLRQYQDESQPMTILFNFTVENIGDEQFVYQLESTAKMYEVKPQQIMIQLNQFAEMQKSKEYMDTIHSLREKGFSVCLAGFEVDRVFFDFLECGINAIKMRYELICQIETPNGYQVVKRLTELCHELNLDVICVGVETENQAQILKNLGCEVASGYHFYYPVSEDVFTELI